MFFGPHLAAQFDTIDKVIRRQRERAELEAELQACETRLYELRFPPSVWDGPPEREGSRRWKRAVTQEQKRKIQRQIAELDA